MDILIYFAVFLVGVILSYFLVNRKSQSQLQELRNELDTEKKQGFLVQDQKSRLEEKLIAHEKELNRINDDLKVQTDRAVEFQSGYTGQKERNQELEKQILGLKQDLSSSNDTNQKNVERLQEYASALATFKSENDHLLQRLDEQKAQFEINKEQVKNEILNLSHSILEEKSKKFTEQNSTQLKLILEPLGLRIDEFKKKVEDTYSEENRERATLKEQIRHMAELNQKMSVEAQNLTKALKGDAKTQGNWGEVILERILEKSGLRKGFEFEVQITERNEENKMIRPDVVVKLPDDKFMIVDSKVSLTAYEQFVNSENDEARKKHIKDHFLSLRTHIKGLADKNYQQLYGAKSPDFVLLFIPIQPAFDVAMMHEPEMYNFAFEQNIILVSPTTLLATLSTVSSVWKQEYQNRHAVEIADQSGRMYDKFVGFVEDLEKVGNAIQTTSKVYNDALNKLSTGKGNLINRAESLKKLGIKANKKLPAQFVEEQDVDNDN